MQNPGNVGAFLKEKYAGKKLLIVAGSATDNSEVTCDEIDRVVNGHLAMSAKLLIAYNFTCAQNETAKLHVDMTDCETSGGSYSSDSEVYALTTVVTGLEGGAEQCGVLAVDLDLRSYDRYLKPKITADLSAANTDTGDWHAVLVLGGFDGLPLA